MPKVDLTGEKATLLATLYGRALDAESRGSILHDTMALDAVRQIEFDFAKTGLRRGDQAAIALRARHFDGWTGEFLAAHPEATVLHWAAAWTPGSTASTPVRAYGGSMWTIPM